MKWNDHRRITKYSLELITPRFGDLEKIVEANVHTDKFPDYIGSKRVSHHSEEGLKIGLAYLKEAKRRYERGESYEIELGRALHYLQDFCVEKDNKELSFGNVRIKSKSHDSIEEFISGIPDKVVTEYLHETYRSLNGTDENLTLEKIYDIALKSGMKRNPLAALKCALRLSTLALTYLTGERKTELTLDEQSGKSERKATKKRHPVLRALYYIAKAIGWAIAIAIGALLFILAISFLIFLASLLIVVVPPLVFLSGLFDSDNRRYKRRRR